jgi:hypothetical protein
LPSAKKGHKTQLPAAPKKYPDCRTSLPPPLPELPAATLLPATAAPVETVLSDFETFSANPETFFSCRRSF